MPSLHNKNFILSLLSILLAIAVLFIQYGYSTYVSFQFICAVAIVVLFILARPMITNARSSLVIFTLFFIFNWCYFSLSSHAPAIYHDPFTRMLTTTVYSALIIAVANIEYQKPEIIIKFMRNLSRSVLTLTLIALTLSETAIFNNFDRASLTLQNADLLFNRGGIDKLTLEVDASARTQRPLRIDLLYGEPSYLALIILIFSFTLIATTQMISKLASQLYNLAQLRSARMGRFDTAIILGSMLTLVMIKSLTSLLAFLALSLYLIVRLVLRKNYYKNIRNLSWVTLIFFLLAALDPNRIFEGAYDELYRRLSTLSASMSFQQRFGPILQFSLDEWLFGIYSSMIDQKIGYQNSMITVISSGGAGGLLFLFSIFFQTFTKMKVNFGFVLAIPCLIAILFQNGELFSPDKFFLLSCFLSVVSIWNQLDSNREHNL